MFSPLYQMDGVLGIRYNCLLTLKDGFSDDSTPFGSQVEKKREAHLVLGRW